MAATGEDRIIIAGGGLAGSLAALAVARLRPEASLLLIEAGPSFGGNHLWSYFDGDIADDHRWLVAPLVEARWEDHEIRFPRRKRIIGYGYTSLASSRLDATVRAWLRPDQWRLGQPVAEVAADHVRLAGGEVLHASAVIDARGFETLSEERRGALDLAWQKFVGRDYGLAAPHDVHRPIIMDATVPQHDGYRFVYTLPFAPQRLMVEDTYYSVDPSLDVAKLGDRLDAYVEAQGWKPVAIDRAEKGVLPVALGGDFSRFLPPAPFARIGVMGGFFHPTTGYSVPDAVRVAMLIAANAGEPGPALATRITAEAHRLWKDRKYYRLLNRMLFRAAEPDQRYRVLEHFYRLEPSRIARFYAGRSNLWDKFAILSGKPPVPIGRALAAMRP